MTMLVSMPVVITFVSNHPPHTFAKAALTHGIGPAVVFQMLHIVIAYITHDGRPNVTSIKPARSEATQPLV